MNIEAIRDYWLRVADRPMRFGGYDCVRFVAETLRVGWNVDHRAALGYQCRRSAVVRLRAAGGLRQACTDVLGPEVPPEALSVGDVAFLRPAVGAAAVGLVMPGYIAVKGHKRIDRVCLSAAVCGWEA